MYCDCPNFRQEFVNLSKDILADGDEKSQWKIFRQFLIKYMRDDIRNIQICMNDIIIERPLTTSCSKRICSLLAHKLNELKRDVPLSTFLVDLMIIMHLHLNLCFRSNVDWLLDVNRNPSFSSDRETLKFLSALRWSDDFKKILLNFGFLCSLSGDSPRLLKELECNFDCFMFSINDQIFSREIRLKTEVAMTLVKNIFSCFKGRDGSKRMYLASVAVRATEFSLSKVYSFTEKCISCFEMYFTGTCDAFISVFEVRSIFYICLKLMNKLYLFDLYCQEFDNLMPGCPIKIEPRKLVHLARCQIRQSLNLSNLPMPTAVEKLFLPKKLKRFLLGDIINISRMTGNASSPKAVSQSEFELLLIRYMTLYRLSK